MFTMEHPLRAFLQQREISQIAFAASLGTTPSYLNQLLIGHRYPSRRMARRIETVTGGVVTAASCLLWQAPPPAASTDAA